VCFPEGSEGVLLACMLLGDDMNHTSRDILAMETYDYEKAVSQERSTTNNNAGTDGLGTVTIEHDIIVIGW